MLLRIFISSPGDVVPERRRAQLVIEKLAKSYARFFSIEPVLWEIEPMLASGHFQDQITPPGETDIVLLIVWSRLGTPLPAKTETREYRGIDGRTPVTGTEWEFEHALAAQKLRGAPDLLAYRKRVKPVAALDDESEFRAAKQQWDSLEAFWSRWFVDRGQFKAGFSDFANLDGFETRLESDLRKLIEARIATLRDASQAGPPPVWLSGSPFRGLDAYRFEHAPVFFGRSAVTKAAVEQLTTNDEAGRAFLLILGASGAGKSSFAQAGVVPALIGRGIIPGVGMWRRALMRPGGHAAGPFAALAEALTSATALPELLASRHDAQALATHLRASADDPSFAIVGALKHAEEAARARGELLAIETARIALVVDQFEELFTAQENTTADRMAFIQCLDGLARSGRVHVIATMRSDHWHRAAETPQLVAMAAGGGQLDLLPATQDEIIEMIRQPAETAGIGFETDPMRKVGLDATLASEAANEPGSLPLLSFLLDELYRKDIRDGRATLTFASMRELGGLRGAIATRAEAIFATLPVDVQAVLPPVLRALVTVSRAGTEPTARAGALAQFANGSAERILVEALLAPQVRLLVADGDGAGARVRPAHEALLTHWERAKRQIAQDRDDLRTRAAIEEALTEYRGAGRRHTHLLRDPQLANAIDLVKRWSGEFNAETSSFIQASRRRARLLQQLILAAAAVFAAVAILAGWQYLNANRLEKVAVEQRNLAEQKRAESDKNLAAAQVTQSRFLADLSTQSLTTGDAVTAALLALAALPDSRAGTARPYVSEAEVALYSSLSDFREIRVIHAHSGSVVRLALSPDRDRLVTASGDRTARVWDAASGELIATLQGHEDVIEAAAFSPDGRRIVTASDDNTARVWDAASGQVIAVLRGHSDLVMGASFSPDGKRVLTTSKDASARVWDAATGSQIAILRTQSFYEGNAAFSPDGRHVATGGRIWDLDHNTSIAIVAENRGSGSHPAFSPDGRRVVTIIGQDGFIWNAETGQPVATLKGHENFISSVRFSPDGRRVLTASDDKTARIWDTETAKLIAVLRGHEAGLRNAAFSADGRQVVTASTDNTARIWDSNSGGLVAVLRGHWDWVTDATFSADGRRVITVSRDQTMRIWDTELQRGPIILAHRWGVNGVALSSDGRWVATASVDAGRIWDAENGNLVAVRKGSMSTVAFSADGQRVVSASENTALIWNAVGTTGDRVAVELRGHEAAVSSAKFSPDGHQVVTASKDGTARVWDAATGRQIAVLRGHASEVWTAAFSPDGKRIVTASLDKTVRIWDVASGRVLASLPHNAVPEGAEFSPDGRRVLTFSLGAAALWDAESGSRIAVLSHDGAFVRNAAFSRDGKRVVTSSNDATARIWDTDTGRMIMVLRGHDDSVENAAFSADGRRVVTASRDKTARLWDMQTGKTIAILRGHQAQVSIAALSPDGQRVLTATRLLNSADDNSVRIWRIFPATQDLVDEAKKVAPRCLTSAQRARAFLIGPPLQWCIDMNKPPFDNFKRAPLNG